MPQIFEYQHARKQILTRLKKGVKLICNVQYTKKQWESWEKVRKVHLQTSTKQEKRGKFI